MSPVRNYTVCSKCVFLWPFNSIGPFYLRWWESVLEGCLISGMCFVAMDSPIDSLKPFISEMRQPYRGNAVEGGHSESYKSVKTAQQTCYWCGIRTGILGYLKRSAKSQRINPYTKKINCWDASCNCQRGLTEISYGSSDLPTSTQKKG